MKTAKVSKPISWVWVGLVILTGMTFSVAGRNLGGWDLFLICFGDCRKRSPELVLNYFHAPPVRRKLSIFRVIIPLVMGPFSSFSSFLTFAGPSRFEAGVENDFFQESTGLSGRVVDNVLFPTF